MITRRTLIRGTAGTLAGTLAGAMVPRSARASVERFQELPAARDERLHTLATTAVDAAMAGGARYADARLTFSQQFEVRGDGFTAYQRVGGIVNRTETMTFGVRAQFDGYWGFASSTVWTKDEAARLGRGAVADAKANVLGKTRDVEMAPNPSATSGDWSMPVAEDPFTLDPNEIFDYLSGLHLHMYMFPGDSKKARAMENVVNSNFSRQQKAFASSDGQFVTQRVYRTGGQIGFTVLDSPWDGGARASGALEQISFAGAGFEYLRHARIREWARQLYEELKEERLLPIIPVDVGRYLTLLHPTGVGQILKRSVGVATEIDRVMGYEANATGTSYIIDPDEMVGSLKIGTPAMHVTGTRSLPGGLSRVRWDDEGVEPKDFTLIQNGVLTSLQTNREGAGWMKTVSEKTGQPMRSHGCAYAAEASDPQLVHPADLILHPDSARDTTLNQLREQMDKGIEFKPGNVSMDFQQSTGMLTGAAAYKIEKGKRVARIAGPGMLFRTSELWGNLQVLGGNSSVRRVGTGQWKGEPIQTGYSSVDAPPALFKEMSVINPAQKA